MGKLIYKRRLPTEKVLNAMLRLALQIICHIDSNDGAEISELVEAYGKNRNTIQGYLNTLEEVGLPLEVVESEGRGKRYRLAVRGQLAKLSTLVQVHQFITSYVGLQQSSVIAGSKSLQMSQMDLLDKIGKLLGPKVQKEILEINRCIHASVRRAWLGSAPDTFWPVVQSIRTSRLIELRYQKKRSGPITTTVVLPQRWYTGTNGAMYLLSWSPEHQAIRTHHMYKIKGVKPLDQHGEPPPGFDPDAMIEDAFDVWLGGVPTDYRILYSAEMEDFIYSRRWHKTVKIEKIRGNRFSVTFRCPATPEVLAFVRSSGRECELVEPPEDRADMLKTGHFYVEVYSKPYRSKDYRKEHLKKKGPPETGSGEPQTASNKPTKPG